MTTDLSESMDKTCIFESPPNQDKTIVLLGVLTILIYVYKYANYSYDRQENFPVHKLDEQLGNFI
jgi:hypothetical protein